MGRQTKDTSTMHGKVYYVHPQSGHILSVYTLKQVTCVRCCAVAKIRAAVNATVNAEYIIRD